MFDKILNKTRHFVCIKCLRCCNLSSFVPKNEPCSEKDVEAFMTFLSHSKRILVLTGAGISTESGIPDYRSEGVGLYARSTNRPVQLQQFMSSEDTRRRYWARNYIGWPRFSAVLPNITHHVLSRWANNLSHLLPSIECIVTQNVDRLHHKANSRSVIELHGTAFKVTCTSCNKTVERHQLQLKMEEENRCLMELMPPTQMIRPDGDVEIPTVILTLKLAKCLVFV
ncbi:NAD-dependent protein lipoamidase sirtuin-4, variant 2 [Chamberlinius hualienensis]